MLQALPLLPFLAGLAAFAIRHDPARRALLVAAAAGRRALVAAAGLATPPPLLGGWIQLDAPGLLFLTIASILFFAVTLYALQYLAHGHAPLAPRAGDRPDAPEAILTGCLLLFLAAMTLVCVSHHLVLLWVAVEATTLASAPLVYYHRHHRSLEAAWKYLMIGSIGIALALLGNFMLAVAGAGAAGPGPPLLLSRLISAAPSLHPVWLQAAFIFLLVGYGTKMGLAPMHTWLPDAHSEAPSIVSALLSGALLNCAFLGILRAHQVCIAAGLAGFSSSLLVLFGLLSILFATVFILGQPNFKRMLAYSSVEHMGILALGIGLGAGGVFGAFWHALNHSFAKAMLFLAAGNILARYGTQHAGAVRGLGRALPFTGALWMIGFLAIVGTPPFGTFFSEFAILQAAFAQGRPVIAILYVLLLALIFVAMASVFLRMLQGDPESSPAPARERLLSWLPPAALGALALIAGLWIPAPLAALLHDAARLLGGS